VTDRLREHFVTLSDGDLVLRPMTEDDWDVEARWNSDPEVLEWSEGSDVESRSRPEVQEIYRGVSQNAFVFIAEQGGRPIGDGWLQEMNIARILAGNPRGADLRRIDLLIGEKELWGRGLGTRMIRLLTRFGFEACGADAIYALPSRNNVRSCRAFEKNGFAVEREEDGEIDLVIRRETWFGGVPGPVWRKPDETTRAVLLDAGGVILDETGHEERHARLISEALVEFVPGYSVERYRQDIDEAVANFCPRAYQYVVWKYLEGDRAAFDRFWAAHIESYRADPPPLTLMPGIDAEIRAMADDFAIALAGQYGHDIMAPLRESGLNECFASLIHQGCFEVTKPDPRFFEQVAHIVGVPQERCIVVGDRIDKDVVPAHTLGMKAVLVRGGLHRAQQPRIPEEIPEVELESVVGLADAVRRLASGSD
jgi:FMN phosphatase YigB (HAD superfamily)/RimJ/RimL family protein N-acetyltransferase